MMPADCAASGVERRSRRDGRQGTVQRCRLKVLQIGPYEPPASGWTRRMDLVRRTIEERGGVCEILDIGPSRRVERPGCVAVRDAGDYVLKVLRFSRRGFSVHCHINGEYFRGVLLALAAGIIARACGNRLLTTFHGGAEQRHLVGWQRVLVGPFLRGLFGLSHAIICNSEAERTALRAFQQDSRIHPIPAFSRQYLEYRTVSLDPPVEAFLRRCRPIVSVYLCFREGFYLDTVVQGLERLVKDWPRLGLAIIGTGDGLAAFRQELANKALASNVCIAGDMGHDMFMTLIARSDLHLRTPVTDGVSATVLEALSLRIPVVASENGTRPPSVVTYRADDPADLASAIDRSYRNRNQLAAQLSAVEIADTVAVEVDLIAGET